MIQASLEALGPVATAKGVVIASRVPPDSCPIEGDVQRLQQVAGNLVGNAIKFTPSGGHIDVELLSGDDSVRIVVRDTGDGIEPDFLPNVFDRFRQGDASVRRQHGGLGLGLAIVRHIVELHGGSVQAESAGRGSGATFAVDLPRRLVDRP
jgi:signal transduction histidine kinase